MHELKVTFPRSYKGQIDVSLVAADSIHYSAPAVYNIRVRANPCVHGDCEPLDPNTFDCSDVSRTVSFDHFRCACERGYEGKQCDKDINECFGNPCDLLYDCQEQGIAAFVCVISLPKILAIVTCIAVAIGASVFGIIICIRKNRPKNKVEPEPEEPHIPPEYVRPQSSASTSEVVPALIIPRRLPPINSDATTRLTPVDTKVIDRHMEFVGNLMPAHLSGKLADQFKSSGGTTSKGKSPRKAQKRDMM